jgi:hypothetical protein
VDVEARSTLAEGEGAAVSSCAAGSLVPFSVSYTHCASHSIYGTAAFLLGFLSSPAVKGLKRACCHAASLQRFCQ